ncbi:hypothetical protein KJ750_01195 [Patescibacteria group bacterium]|nr:hypothetical protein [Patescibacteria group bacterium]MBU2263261.1 hypothetical protein [Patescibacteria group bacterium]
MQPEGENKIGSAGEEIESLRKRIAELETVSQNKERTEVIKEAIKEHVGKSPEEFLAEGNRFTQQEIKQHAQKIGDTSVEKQHQEQILELMQIAQSKGILNAVSVIKRLNDPYLEDEFHGALVKYFQATY